VKEGEYEIALGAFGESLARWDNYIEIDRDLKDAWGIPALRISMTHGDNEAALMEDAGAMGAEMLEAAGAKDIRMHANVEMPGMAIHELGTARMGNDPKKSVLNSFNQAHDVKNLFVMDGASFVSSACQNPTLSMMAITVRACANLIDRFRKNEM
jgi:choline dehydrogenase-like flavoprotein